MRGTAPSVGDTTRQLRHDAKSRRSVRRENDVGQAAPAAAANVEVRHEAADQLVLAQQCQQLVARHLPYQLHRAAGDAEFLARRVIATAREVLNRRRALKVRQQPLSQPPRNADVDQPARDVDHAIDTRRRRASERSWPTYLAVVAPKRVSASTRPRRGKNALGPNPQKSSSAVASSVAPTVARHRAFIARGSIERQPAGASRSLAVSRGLQLPCRKKRRSAARTASHGGGNCTEIPQIINAIFIFRG